MEVRDYKVDCTLSRPGETVTGLTHVIEVAYSERITFCNFVMEATEIDAPESGVPLDAPRELRLPDGRKAIVRVTSFRVVKMYTELAGTGVFS